MKRKTALILALLLALSLCACAKSEGPQPTAAPTATPAPSPAAPTPSPAPPLEPATVKVDDSRIVWKVFDRGAEVTVLGTLDDWYIIEGDDADLLISQRRLRLSTEPAFETRTAFARHDAVLFSQPDFDGKDGIALSTNTKLNVLDGKDDWLYVECDKGSGYVSGDKVSDYYIDFGGGYSGYSGGGGNSGGGGSPGGGGGSGGGGSSGQDGGDIELRCHVGAQASLQFLGAWNGPEYTAMDKTAAMVLCDNTEAYLCIFNRGDTVQVAEKGTDESTLMIGELMAKIPSWRLSFADDKPYVSWEGYSQRNVVFYGDYGLEKELEKLNGNNKLTVLDEIEQLQLYLVEYNGRTGFMRHEDVSKTPIYVDSGYSYGGYSGGGDSGGGSGGGTGDTGAEWTEPRL